MSEKNIRVAQIRGDGLSDRETKTWEYFPKDIEQTVFSARKNVYYQSKLPFPVVTLPCSSDNFLSKNFYKYFFGRYKQMFGLEEKLAGFDIVHAGEIYNYYTYQAVQAKKTNKNLKVVATVWENSFGRFEYNYWPGFKMPPRYWREHLQKIIGANAAGVDMFIPATNDAAELLIDFGVDENRIKVVTPGIIPAKQIENFSFPPEFAGKEIYLSVTRLVKEKGVYDMLYAWRRYLSKTKNPEQKLFVFIGDGPERDNLMRIVSDWKFGGRVAFVRQVPYGEVLEYYKKAKCFVLGSMPMPTWQEQFGYVFGEAICAGVPVIATYCGAIPEVIGEAGLLVTPAHPIAMSDALLIIDDPAVYARLKTGCEKEKHKFAAELYASQVAGIYRDLTR